MLSPPSYPQETPATAGTQTTPQEFAFAAASAQILLLPLKFFAHMASWSSA